MSPVGRGVNSLTTSMTRANSSTTPGLTAAPNSPARSSRRSNKTSPSKPNDIPQRILAILESAASPSSVATSVTNSSPSTNSGLQRHRPSDVTPSAPMKRRNLGQRHEMQGYGTGGAVTIKSEMRTTFKKPIMASQRSLRRPGRRGSRQSSVGSNGMPPPPVPSKVNFRARALDPQRQMPIHVVKTSGKNELAPDLEMLYNNKVLKKPLFNVPTGMEKEEEKELHLRKAIEAQKAQSTGLLVVDHMIPTRQVEAIGEIDYNRFCKWERNIIRPDHYLFYQRGDFDFCDEDTSYDADEYDNEWLIEQQNFITLDEFEKIIEKLEVLSRDRVPDVNEIWLRHPELSIEALERVYDHWLERKMKMVSENKMNAFLVPFVPNKAKSGEKDNPYIAFRHRGPKVTTRRKQKLETEHYGTMLTLAAAVRRTHLLTKAIVERENLKLALMECDENLFDEELVILEGGSNLDPNLYSINSLSMPVRNSKWLSKLWYDVVKDVLDITKPVEKDKSLLSKVSSFGPDDGRFAFQTQPYCTYKTHRPSDPAIPHPSAKYVNLMKPKPTFPLPNVKRECSSDIFEPAPYRRVFDFVKRDVKVMDDCKQRFVDIGSDTWKDLTGETSRVLCRARYGRSGRLNLDFIKKDG